MNYDEKWWTMVNNDEKRGRGEGEKGGGGHTSSCKRDKLQTKFVAPQVASLWYKRSFNDTPSAAWEKQEKIRKYKKKAFHFLCFFFVFFCFFLFFSSRRRRNFLHWTHVKGGEREKGRRVGERVFPTQFCHGGKGCGEVGNEGGEGEEEAVTTHFCHSIQPKFVTKFKCTMNRERTNVWKRMD